MNRTDVQISTYSDSSDTIQMSMKHMPTGLSVSAFGTNTVILKLKLLEQLKRKVNGGLAND